MPHFDPCIFLQKRYLRVTRFVARAPRSVYACALPSAQSLARQANKLQPAHWSSGSHWRSLVGGTAAGTVGTTDLAPRSEHPPQTINSAGPYTLYTLTPSAKHPSVHPTMSKDAKDAETSKPIRPYAHTPISSYTPFAPLWEPRS
jgi:hypothetical protein